jgi:hypothetical protein
MLAPSILKQMRNDTFITFNMQKVMDASGRQFDEHDYQVLNDYIRKSRNLRELDCTSAWNSFEQLSEGLKQNRSIVKLDLAQQVQNRNVDVLIDILQNNPTISQLNIDNCGSLEGEGFAKFVKFMETNSSITHLDAKEINTVRVPGQNTYTYNPWPLIDVLTKNINILSFTPVDVAQQHGLDRTCAANRAVAAQLIKKATQPDNRELTAEDLGSIGQHYAAFLSVAENEMICDKTRIAQMLVNLEDAATRLHESFYIPAFYAPLAATLPLPFYPADTTVNFVKKPTTKPLTSVEIYEAVEAGQVDELLSFMQKQGSQITAADCLFKPEGRDENMVQVFARQGALTALMTVANWTGNPRGFKAAADAVPVREWTRQMSGLSPDTLLSRINAVSFKKAHQLRM